MKKDWKFPFEETNQHFLASQTYNNDDNYSKSVAKERSQEWGKLQNETFDEDKR